MSTATAPANTTADDKEFAGLRARLGLRGVMLMRSHPDDGPPIYVVTHGGQWAKTLRTLGEVADFARRVGASP